MSLTTSTSVCWTEAVREGRRRLVSVRLADQAEALLLSHTAHGGDTGSEVQRAADQCPERRFLVSSKERLEKHAVTIARAAAASRPGLDNGPDQ